MRVKDLKAVFEKDLEKFCFGRPGKDSRLLSTLLFWALWGFIGGLSVIIFKTFFMPQQFGIHVLGGLLS